MTTLLVLPGDGIGPKRSQASVQVLRAISDKFGLSFSSPQAAIEFAALAAEGSTIP